MAKVTSDGIEIDAQLQQIAEPGALKDRLDEAWQSIKVGLVSGLSIGFKGVEVERIKDTFGVRFVKWLWLELSAVTIPANAEGTIQTLKSIDVQQRAASGQEPLSHVVRLNPPGVSGPSKTRKTPEEGKEMKTIAEQITALEAKRAASVAAQETEMQKSIEDDRTADGEEGEKFDELQAEIETIDKQLGRLRKLERTKAATAKPVIQVDTPESASASRDGTLVVRAEPKLPPGIGFARVAKCIALGAKYNRDPAVMAEQLYGPNSVVVARLGSLS